MLAALIFFLETETIITTIIVVAYLTCSNLMTHARMTFGE